MSEIKIDLFEAKQVKSKDRDEFIVDRTNLGIKFYENEVDTNKSIKDIKQLFKKDDIKFIIITVNNKKFGSMLGSLCDTCTYGKFFVIEYMIYDDNSSSELIKEIVQKLKNVLHVNNLYGIVNTHAGGLVGYFYRIGNKHELMFGEDPKEYVGIMI
jgi:hypothetical protein